MQSVESGEGLIERKLRLEEAIRAHAAAWESGRWTPKDDEILVRHVEPDYKFPSSSVPEIPEFIMGCALYQTEENIPYLSPDPSIIEQEIAAYERAITMLGKQYGHDLCWEHFDAIYRLLPERRNVQPQGRGLFDRMRLCLTFRERIANFFS